MPTIDRQIRIAILLLVCASGLLLGTSLSNRPLTIIAVFGAVLGFLLCDHFRVFRLTGLLANLASVIILLLAMKDFFPGDSTGKLVSVAKLLVYLQTILMFQEKIPRLNWQILVLSLLQVVVAAIFSLDLEGGFLFLFYFFLAGITMFLQMLYSSNRETRLHNQRSASVVLSRTERESANPVMFLNQPVAGFQAAKSMLLHLAIWMVITMAFTTAMFFMVPRHTTPWFGTNTIQVATTGFSKSVDLLNRDQIQQSNQLIFRASFESFQGNSRELRLHEPPYFRGMALSSLIVEDGRTNWRAPHDRIHQDAYQPLGSRQGSNQLILQTIKLEETADPLIYSVMPPIPLRQTSNRIEFCQEMSALTRCKINERIDLSPFKYELGVLMDNHGSLLTAWPYVTNSHAYQQLPMSNDLPQQKWLTTLDPDRYPAVVGLADSIVAKLKAQNDQVSRLEIVRAFENYFLTPGRFRYTLDFRNIKWTEDVDPIEDFVRNHRSGHCELFASALTVMLRSQDIPARLVVGFHGGDYNSINQSLMIRGKHAHAWVEAYLRPEDCTSKMLETGAAGPGGAWQLADPTPSSSVPAAASTSTEAIDLARTMWQDYVLGMEGEVANEDAVSIPVPFLRLLQNIDWQDLEQTMEGVKKTSWGSGLRMFLGAMIVLPFLIPWVASWWSKSNDKKKPSQKLKVSRLRRWVADAISYISPSLSHWVLSRTEQKNLATAFYHQMTALLQTHGRERKSTQTYRDFANEVAQSFSEHPLSTMISSTVWEVTEIFQSVRFGNQNIPADLREQISIALDELESGLLQTRSAKVVDTQGQ